MEWKVMTTFTYTLPDETVKFEPRPRSESGVRCTLAISVGPARDGLLWSVNGKPIGTSAQMAALLGATLRAMEANASKP
jgi:hypothetical protein